MKILVKYYYNENEIKFNSFTEIKNYDEVVSINCSFNKLTSLPKLPKSLKELNCESNELTSLPELPDSLQNLLCFYNKLTSLPKLPNSLHYQNFLIHLKNCIVIIIN
jgi:Leucine-rich repeat (LRR) protein